MESSAEPGRSPSAPHAPPSSQGVVPPREPLQPLDLTSLRAVVSELVPLLVPSRFEKAQQAESCGLQLALRGLHGTTWLTMSWQAEAPRLHAIPPPPRLGEGSTLARQLQHGLRGLALVALQQPTWERVVELHFAPRPGDAVERVLVLELMGRHSNLFLLDAERQVIALGRQVRPAQSRLRPIGTGDPYVPPPAPAGEPPQRQESFASWRRRLALVPLPLGKALLSTYQGTSPALVRQLLPDPGWAVLPLSELQEVQWHQLWQRWQQWLEALERGWFQMQWQPLGGYRCWAEGAVPGAAADPDPLAINRALAAYYEHLLAQRQRQQRQQGLEQRLRAALIREQEQWQRQQELLAAVPASEALQHQADALLCLPQPEREQIDEAQALYRRARKLRRSVAAITPRLELHRQRITGLETSLTFLEQLDADDDLAPLEEELNLQLERLRPAALASGRRAAGRAGRRSGHADPIPLELRTASGLRLQVGRNHRQNEWISLRQAHRGDLWFHAQEQPGSHVVLKASEGLALEPDLQVAADLAAHFSRGRGNRRVPVVMVATEDLQRIPGAEPGTVRHRGGTVLWGEPERALALLNPPGSASALRLPIDG